MFFPKLKDFKNLLKNLSSWPVTFSFAIDVLCLSPTLFAASHANRDCLSSTEFLILSI